VRGGGGGNTVIVQRRSECALSCFSGLGRGKEEGKDVDRDPQPVHGERKGGAERTGHEPEGYSHQSEKGGKGFHEGDAGENRGLRPEKKELAS